MRSITKNKHAWHDYTIEKEFTCGIVLQGHEVKSIKTSNVNIKDALVRIDKGEIWIVNMDVPLYGKTSPLLAPSYEAKGKRKLLMNKKELAKISASLDKSGIVLIPLEVFVTKRGLIKITVWLGKLMRKVEKKQVLKEKDIDRQMQRDIKGMRD